MVAHHYIVWVVKNNSMVSHAIISTLKKHLLPEITIISSRAWIYKTQVGSRQQTYPIYSLYDKKIWHGFPCHSLKEIDLIYPIAIIGWMIFNKWWITYPSLYSSYDKKLRHGFPCHLPKFQSDRYNHTKMIECSEYDFTSIHYNIVHSIKN